MVLICDCEPVSVTAPVPLPATEAPPAEATVRVPFATASVVVIDAPPASTSLSESPPIDRLVSSFTLSGPALAVTHVGVPSTLRFCSGGAESAATFPLPSLNRQSPTNPASFPVIVA